jgi:hypothetical protein
MKITACPKCGSTDIEMGTMDTGVTFGVTSWKSVCKECGYHGEPLVFDSKEDYEHFLQGLSKEEESAVCSTEEDESSQLSKKDKEVVTLLKEEISDENIQKEETNRGEIFSKNKSWWIEIVVALMIAAAIVASYVIFSPFGEISISLIYGAFLFILLTVIGLFIIVVIEYAFLSIKRSVSRKE